MHSIRSGIWYFKGLREYTKKGYEAASARFDPKDLDNVDLNGKIVMITGANSGIGKCAAMTLAKMGAEIHLVCRNPTSAEEAKTEITEATGNPNVHTHTLDMSIPKDVVRFGSWYVREGKALDVLVNNAGCMVNTREVDQDGLEKNFATNTLGTYVLTSALIPALMKSTGGDDPSKPRPRVITVSSGGMLTQKLNLDDLQSEKMKKFDGTSVYAQNKRQQVVVTEQWAKKFPEIFFASMHPGWADTPAVRSSMPGFYEKMKDKLRTAEQGADTIVWLAAAAKALESPSGSFFQDRAVVPKHLPLSRTSSPPAEEEKLVSILEDMYLKYKE